MEVSTTMAFVRVLRSLMKDKTFGQRVVPIIPDEARTFGMDPLFAEFGIYHPEDNCTSRGPQRSDEVQGI